MERMLGMEVEEAPTVQARSLNYIEHFREEHLMGEEVGLKIEYGRRKSLLEARSTHIAAKELGDSMIGVEVLDVSASSADEDANVRSEIPVPPKASARLERLRHW